VNLHGPVRATESAGSGETKLTLSFDAWKDGHVAPSTHTVTVVRPRVTVKEEPVSSRLIRTLVHPDRKTSFSLLKFSADGKRLAAAGYPSGVLQVWDVAAGKELARVEAAPGYRGTDRYIVLTADWKTAYESHQGRKVVRSEKDGAKHVLIDYDGEVRVWDVATGKPRPAIKLAPHRGASEAVVSPDGDRLITTEARAYDPKGVRYVPHAVVYRDLTGKGPPVELGDGYSSVAFDPSGRTFALATSDREAGQGQLRLYDARTGKPTATLVEKSKSGFFSPVFSPDGKRVAAVFRTTSTLSAGVRVWDVASGQELAELVPAESVAWLQHDFSPDGRFVTANTDKGVGYVWDVATGKAVLTCRFGEKGFTRSVAVSPDGRLAAAVGRPVLSREDSRGDPDPADLPQPHVVLYDLSTGKVVDTLVCPHGVPGPAVFSPDGKALAVGSFGAVHLFDVK
jgi:WD40 repeat protein